MKTTTTITHLFIIIRQLFYQELLRLESSTSKAMSNRPNNSGFIIRKLDIKFSSFFPFQESGFQIRKYIVGDYKSPPTRSDEEPVNLLTS